MSKYLIKRHFPFYRKEIETDSCRQLIIPISDTTYAVFNKLCIAFNRDYNSLLRARTQGILFPISIASIISYSVASQLNREKAIIFKISQDVFNFITFYETRAEDTQSDVSPFKLRVSLRNYMQVKSSLGKLFDILFESEIVHSFKFLTDIPNVRVYSVEKFKTILAAQTDPAMIADYTARRTAIIEDIIKSIIRLQETGQFTIYLKTNNTSSPVARRSSSSHLLEQTYSDDLIRREPNIPATRALIDRINTEFTSLRIPPPQTYPVSDRIIEKYVSGRMDTLDDNYVPSAALRADPTLKRVHDKIFNEFIRKLYVTDYSYS